MQYYNNTLAIEANWLIQVGIMSTSVYRHLTNRKQVNVIRRGCLNTPALVEYDSLPERFKREVKKIVPEPYKAVRINQIQERIVENAEARDFFDNYRLDDGRYLPAEKRREYYANAQILDAIHQIIINKRAKRSALGHRATRAWEQIAEGVQEIGQSKYPHQLPVNPRRLEDKYRMYKKEGLESLIHKNFQNKNAIKVEEGENEAMMAMLISDPRNLDNEQVRSLYNMMAEKMGWKKISAPTVARWRDKLDNMLYARRRGSVAFSNTKAMQVKRSAPSYPLYFWTMDGWDVELMYQMTENGRTTYHNRPTVVIVLDACCKYPIGYAVGTHETPELIQAALRNAALHTESLFGQMYRTNQLQSDRYALSKMTTLYSGVADKVTPARAKNAKAKIIEPYFNSINKKYCQMAVNWSGYGITSDKNKQPNSEFLNKYKKNFPDFEGVCMQVAEIVERERAEKREEYLSKWGECPSEHKILLPYENYLMLFGATTGHKNLLQGSGMKVTINGRKYDYDCFDHDFRKYASTRWEVRYDPQDLSRVLAVNEDESLRFLLEEKYVQPMALRERKEGDSAQLQRVRNFNKQYEEKVSIYISSAQDQAKELMAGIPQLDTLNRLMITDSKGQHKNRRNDNRLPIAKKDEVREVLFARAEENDTMWDKF